MIKAFSLLPHIHQEEEEQTGLCVIIQGGKRAHVLRNFKF